MLKDASYKDKFAMLEGYMPLIIDTIKRDLRNEHLRNDPIFVKRYFSGKNPLKLTAEELAPAYIQVMATEEKAEELGEFIANRWILKHGDLYHYFEEALTQLNPNFTELTTIEAPEAKKIMEGSIEKFGAIATLLFSVFNSVVFPRDVYAILTKKATDQIKNLEVEEIKAKELHSIEHLKLSNEQQIARLTDKYEKKLLGLQNKYIQDVGALRKQISALKKTT